MARPPGGELADGVESWAPQDKRPDGETETMDLKVLRLRGCVSGLVAATTRTEGRMCPKGKRSFGEYWWQEPLSSPLFQALVSE